MRAPAPSSIRKEKGFSAWNSHNGLFRVRILYWSGLNTMALLLLRYLFSVENLLSLSQNSKRRMIQRIHTICLMFGLLGVLFVLTLPAFPFTTIACGFSTQVTQLTKTKG